MQRLIANIAAGADPIDLAAARSAGIIGSNPPGALTETTAELAILLILMAKRLRSLTRLKPDANALMDDAALARFAAHYERLTRHSPASMAAVADFAIYLDSDRRCLRS